ncbi:MAG: trehalose-phosphatase [Pirellulales bacterium]|nr:trehalose-phosphatase [Pirellulales bacterium]
MSPSIEDALEAMRVLYLDGGALVLLLDYDGTLTPIVARPELALLAPDTRRLLAQLAALPRVHVGVVSGRKLEEVRALVDLPGIYYAGAAGMELDLNGKRLVHPRAEVAEAAVAKLIVRLTETVSGYPGAWVEDKRFSCTVHYRDVAAEQIDQLRGRVEEVAQREEADRLKKGDCPPNVWKGTVPLFETIPAGDGMRIVEGPMALEIAPDMGWNKGTAVRMILDHLDAPQAMVVYAGDAANDAEAFDAVAAVAGITLGVGPDTPSAVRFRLPDPAALHDFLSRLATAL